MLAAYRPLLIQMLRYGAVGLLNTAIGLGTILVLQYGAGAGPYWANAGGYLAGLAVSFVLNRGWTFGARDRTGQRAGRFVLAFAVAYGVNLAVLTLLMQIPAVPLGMAQAAAIVAYSVLFFVLCRSFVFAAPDGTPAGVRR